MPAIARRIRSLRQQDPEWSMRTSELMSTTVRRVLLSTKGGADELRQRNFWSLVETVVRNLLIDKFRRRGVRREVLRRLRTETRRTEPDAVADGAAALVDARDAAARLLQALTPSERSLVLLRMQGLEWRQVAEALGIAEDAARQRWAALRRKARMGALGLEE